MHEILIVADSCKKQQQAFEQETNPVGGLMLT
jgi:hypothetical protein